MGRCATVRPTENNRSPEPLNGKSCLARTTKEIPAPPTCDRVRCERVLAEVEVTPPQGALCALEDLEMLSAGADNGAGT